MKPNQLPALVLNVKRTVEVPKRQIQVRLTKADILAALHSVYGNGRYLFGAEELPLGPVRDLNLSYDGSGTEREPFCLTWDID